MILKNIGIKHNRLRLLLAAMGLLLGACHDDMPYPAAMPDNDILRLNFSTDETRADLNDAGAGTFSENDRIGL